MNDEETEIARRLVACKGWAWLPGMMADGRGRVCNTDDGVMELANVDGRYSGMWSVSECIPDLSDDLTRLGVLAVVRRAWGDEMAYVRPVYHWRPWPQRSWLWVWEAGVERNRQTGFKTTELEALLEALEAAP